MIYTMDIKSQVHPLNLSNELYQAMIKSSYAKRIKEQPAQPATREYYEYMLATNPELKELVDKFELNPIFDSQI